MPFRIQDVCRTMSLIAITVICNGINPDPGPTRFISPRGPASGYLAMLPQSRSHWKSDLFQPSSALNDANHHDYGILGLCVLYGSSTAMASHGRQLPLEQLPDEILLQILSRESHPNSHLQTPRSTLMPLFSPRTRPRSQLHYSPSARLSEASQDLPR